MGNADHCEFPHRVAIPPSKPFLKSFSSSLKETLFPDDPFRQFKMQPFSKRIVLALQYFIPILSWAPHYSLSFLRSDIISGITIASLSVPQGISYASLASLPPIVGLYSSFVPPLVYAMMGSSRDLAVGPAAVPSLLMSSLIGKEVNPTENPKLYLQLVLTATFFGGVFQACLGFLRFGFIVDFLSHAAIVGFMGGAATVVGLQQLKGILGLKHFTHSTDIISVCRSIFTQTNEWKWQSALLGCCFLSFLVTSRQLRKRRPAFFWLNALAPLISVILGSAIVCFIHADKHGIQVIGHLKKGLNPVTLSELASGFGSPYLKIAIKVGIINGIIAFAEGVAVGRSLAILKNYHIDGNKEMIAFGMMNIVGSCTSCYLATGPFSRSAVNYNAGCKTAGSNIVMAMAIMMTLSFLTPLFHYTPLLVLSAIIMTAMLGLLDYQAVLHLYRIDKFDFVVCMAAYFGVVFGSVEVGLMIAVTISLLRVLLLVARPKTSVLGNIPNSMIYRSIDQYPNANHVPGVLVLQIDGPIYFANTNYLRERISRWIFEEEDKIKASGENSLQYVILDLGTVASIDTSGVSMLDEVLKIVDRKGLKLVLANPRSEVIKKLNKSKLIETIGQEWIYLTVAEAVAACSFMLHNCKANQRVVESNAQDNNV